VRTYETTHKTSVSSDASSTSNKCNYTTIVAKSNESPVIAAIKKTEIKTVLQPASDQNVRAEVNVFPNPANTRTIVRVSVGDLADNALSLMDVFGRTHAVKITNRLSKGAIEIDLSSLIPGMYFIKLKTKTGYRSVALMKQ
jgi:hypothetical protein